MSLRLAAACAIYLMSGAAVGLLLIWLLSSPVQFLDPNEPAVWHEVRLLVNAVGIASQRPFVFCGLADIIGLPLAVAAWVEGMGGKADAVAAAGRATLLSLVTSLLFAIAISAALALAPSHISVMANWSMTYYGVLVLAYNVAFIPTAMVAFALVRRLPHSTRLRSA